MRWVTRSRPKIDRVACPWLVTHLRRTPGVSVRDCCGGAEDGTEKDAVPFDIPGVELSHDGELCSFDA